MFFISTYANNIFTLYLRKYVANVFTYHRCNLLKNRNGDRQLFDGIPVHFRDRSRGFAILEYIFHKFVMLLLHLGEYPYAALTPGRISLRI